MNKTENNKTQVDFSNIRNMQNLIRLNGIPSLANGLKSLKQRLDSVGAKINEGKKNKPISAEKIGRAHV